MFYIIIIGFDLIDLFLFDLNNINKIDYTPIFDNNYLNVFISTMSMVFDIIINHNHIKIKISFE